MGALPHQEHESRSPWKRGLAVVSGACNAYRPCSPGRRLASKGRGATGARSSGVPPPSRERPRRATPKPRSSGTP
eukprot:9493987-Pyramimonas_sp.AAC.1